MGSFRDNRARLFSEVRNEDIRGSGLKFPSGESQMSIKRNIFTLRVLEQWPRNAVETTSLGIFKTQLDKIGDWIRDLQVSSALIYSMTLCKPAQVKEFDPYVFTCLMKFC